MNISLSIKEFRILAGWTQQDLASQSGVSLATLQNIESGRGNPEFSTLRPLLETLGVELNLKPQPIDWDLLSSFGVPLTVKRKSKAHVNKQELRNLLHRISVGLNDLKSDSREEKALLSFLSALKDHYPSVWKSVSPALKSKYEKETHKVSLKLRRLSLETLKGYL